MSTVDATVEDLKYCRIIVLRKEIRNGYRNIWKCSRKYSVKCNCVYGLKMSILNIFFCRRHAYAYTNILPLEKNHIVL